MSTHVGMWQRDVILTPTQTTTQRRRAGKAAQHPATAATLADGRSPRDRLPVAATTEKGVSHATVAVAGPRRIVVAVLVLAVLGMAAYAITRVAAGVQAVVDSGLPGWLVPFVLGLLVRSRLSFKAGQYHRGYMHARGIRKSHWAAISGRGH